MGRYLLRRVLSLLPVLVVVSIVAFVVMHLTPGDPAGAMLGISATPEEIAALRQQLGLDRPLPVQLMQWAWHALHGDYGSSIFFHQPVTEVLAARLQPTLLLAVAAELIAVVVGVPAGVVAATHRGRRADQGLMVLALVVVSVPEFWLALNLILLFSVRLGWLPAAGYSFLSEHPVQTFRSLLLPAVSLGLMQAAFIARMTRSAMIEVLSQDYVRTARAKGVTARNVVYQHGLRNALVPVITSAGLTFSVLVGGAAVAETVFNLPGIGKLVVDAVSKRDYPVIQGVLLLSSLANVGANLAVDLVYSLIDPRIKYV